MVIGYLKRRLPPLLIGEKQMKELKGGMQGTGGGLPTTCKAWILSPAWNFLEDTPDPYKDVYCQEEIRGNDDYAEKRHPTSLRQDHLDGLKLTSLPFCWDDTVTFQAFQLYKNEKTSNISSLKPMWTVSESLTVRFCTPLQHG